MTINGIQVIDAQPGDSIKSALINNYSALSIPAYWRAQEFKAENLASFPRHVYLNGAKYDQPHRLDKLLSRRPNSYQTAHAFWRTIFFHLGHFRNGYAEIKFDRLTADIVSLHNLMPDEVVPYRFYLDPTEEEPDPEPLQFYYHTRTKRHLHASSVLHFSALSTDGMAGDEIVSLHCDTFKQAKAVSRHATKFLEKGTLIRGSIEIPAEASKEQRAEIIADLGNFRAGGSRDVIVLSGGAKLNNATLTPHESQLIEQDRDITKKIAQVTGVDPQFLFDYSESKYNGNPEARGQEVVRYTFRTLIEHIEDELTVKLHTEADQEQGFTIRLNANALMRGDTATQAEVVAKLVTAGVETRNEGRDTLGLPADPDPESDKLKTLGDASPAPATTENSEQPQPDAYAALRPMLDDAIERVETRAAKIIADKKEKPSEQQAAWLNVFADQQAKYAAEAIAPVARAIEALTGRKLDLDQISERYANEIRGRAAGREATPLSVIVGE